MSIVTIKEVKGLVTCSEDGSAEHVFNVKNATDAKLIIRTQVLIHAPAKADWLTINAPDEMNLDPDMVTQIPIHIAVPDDCKPGKYSYRLRVYDPDNPGERFSEADAVYFEVPGKQPVPEPEVEKEEKKKSWILPVVIALAAIVIAGVVIWAVRPKSEVVVAVPPLVGKRLDLALEKFGEDFVFNAANMKKLWKGNHNVGKVVAQAPAGGQKVSKHTEIILTVGKSRSGIFILPEVMLNLEKINPKAFKTIQKMPQPGNPN